LKSTPSDIEIFPWIVTEKSNIKPNKTQTTNRNPFITRFIVFVDLVLIPTLCLLLANDRDNWKKEQLDGCK